MIGETALEKRLREHRRAIDRREAKTFREIETAYQIIERELRVEFEALERELNAIRDRGAAVTQTLLNRETRLQLLLAQVREQVIKFGATAAAITTREQRAAVELTIKQATEILQIQGAVLPQGFGTFDPRTVENAIGLMGDGSPLLDYYREQLSPRVAEAIRAEVITAAATGKSFDKIADRLVKTGQITRNRALAVARTEVNRVRHETDRQFYQENDDIIEGWEWVAKLDSRTCPVCLALDGEIFPLEKPFPQHINDRCTSISVLIDGDRIVRKIGRDWFDEQPAKEKEKIIGKEGLEFYKRGEIELKDFVKFKQDPRFGESVSQKPLIQVLGDKGLERPEKPSKRKKSK